MISGLRSRTRAGRGAVSVALVAALALSVLLGTQHDHGHDRHPGPVVRCAASCAVDGGASSSDHLLVELRLVSADDDPACLACFLVRSTQADGIGVPPRLDAGTGGGDLLVARTAWRPGPHRHADCARGPPLLS
jgi:hypothetical protein